MKKKSHARYYQKLLHRYLGFKPKLTVLSTESLTFFIQTSALPIPAINLGEVIPLPFFRFWYGDDGFWKNSTLKWCGDQLRGDRKGVIPRLRKLALGGASWYLCVRGLSVNTALRSQGLARGCPPRLRRRRIPATSKIGEGIFPRFSVCVCLCVCTCPCVCVCVCVCM